MGKHSNNEIQVAKIKIKKKKKSDKMVIPSSLHCTTRVNPLILVILIFNSN